MARLVTFGGLRIENGTPINGVANPRSRLAILAVLAVAGERGVRREKLVAMFWPESDEDRGRNALRQALFVLRRDIDVREITTGNADLRLNVDVLPADVVEFEAAMRADRFEEAVAIYRGPFLDGVYVREAAEFERWVEEQRQRLAAEYARALESLAVSAETSGDALAAARWWGRRAAHEPLSSRVARRYVEALVTARDREAAIGHVAAHADLVRRELDADPDAALVELAERLKRTPPIARRSGTEADAGAESIGGPGDAARGDAPARDRPVAGDDALLEGADARNAVGTHSPALPRASTSRRRSRMVAAMIVVALIGGTVIVAPRIEAGHRLDPKRIAVDAFENETGDSSLEHVGQMAADWVTEGLSQTSLVDVAETFAGRWRATASATAGDTTLVARASSVAGATGAGLVLTGRYYLVHDSLYLRGDVIDASSRTILRSLPATVSTVADPLVAIEALREHVMGAMSTWLDPRLKSWATAASQPASFEAYQAFSEGLAHIAAHDGRGAIPFLERASRMDTTFYVPLLWLIPAYADARRRDEVDSLVRYLDARSDRLAPLDRAVLDLHKANLHGNPGQQFDAVMRVVRLAPRSDWNLDAASAALRIDRPREALQLLDQLDPAQGHIQAAQAPYAFVYHQAYHRLGQFERGMAVMRDAISHLPSKTYVLQQYEIEDLAALARMPELEYELDHLIMGETYLVPWERAVQELVTHGHPREAAEVQRRFEAMVARMTDSARTSPDVSAERAWMLLALGRAQDAQAIGRSIESLRLIALAAAELGDRATADSAVDAMLAEQPNNVKYLAAAASVAAMFGDRSKAHELLRRTYLQNKAFEFLHYPPGLDSLRTYPAAEALLRANR